MKKMLSLLVAVMIMAADATNSFATVTSDAGLSLDLAADITLTGTQNNLALPSGSSVRFTGISAITITGIVAPTNSRILIIHNDTTSDMNINHLDVLSVAANQIITDTAAAIVVPGGSSVVIQYDLTEARWRTLGRAGKGITSLNTLTGVTQTFAVGTTGTDFGISSAGTTHTFNLPDASTTARGAITTGTQSLVGQKNFTGGITVTCTDCITDANVVAALTISGGTVNSTTIGATTPSTGAFTTLSSTGVTTLGNNSSTVAIDSSDWDITATGVVTGFNDVTFDAGATGGIDLNPATAAVDTAGDTFDLVAGAGGVDGGDVGTAGGAGGALTLTGGLGGAESDGGDVILLGGAAGAGGTPVTGIVRVGTGGTLTTTKATNLLFVTGALEVDGATRFDGTITGAGANFTSIGATTAGTGAFTTLTASGAVTLSGAGTGLSVTNNATVGGTLGVTGVTTLTGGASTAGNITPSVDNTQNVGTDALRFARVRAVTVVTGDLEMSDSRYGHWTIREGKNGIYAYNDYTKKYYRIALINTPKNATSFWSD